MVVGFLRHKQPVGRGSGIRLLLGSAAFLVTFLGVHSLVFSAPTYAYASSPGINWSIQQSYPLGPVYFISVSCPTTSTCFAVGGLTPSLYEITDSGTTWTNDTPSLPSGVTTLIRVSCTSLTFCEAVGGSLLGSVALLWNGVNWSSQTIPPGVGILYGVSCTSSTFCEAVGNSSSNAGFYIYISYAVLLWNGTNWSSQTLPSRVANLSGVSCTSSTFCEAVGSNSSGDTMAFLWNGTNWSTQTIPSGITALNGLSCTSSSFCEAVGEGYRYARILTTAPPPAPVSGTYVPIAPVRICDTRPSNPSGLTGEYAQCTGHTLSPYIPLDVKVAGIASVPVSGVASVVLNITSVNERGNGYITVYPSGSSLPPSSSLNFVAGYPRANLVQVGIGVGDQISIVSDAPTDVIVDLEGYYTSSSSGGKYVALQPERICDTRLGNPSGLTGEYAQCTGHTLSPYIPLDVTVAGIASVPVSGVASVVLNITSVNERGNGYITVYPANLSSPPTSSNVNFTKGEGAVPNRVIIPVSSDGTVDLVSNTDTNAIVDITGYYTSSSSSSTTFMPLSSPVRILDTRCATTPQPSFCATENIPAQNAKIDTLGAGQAIVVQVTRLDGIPSGANAVSVNVTATKTTYNGFLSVNPSTTPPNTSDLNWMTGNTVSNLTIATLSSGGTIKIYNLSGATDVIVDVMGYYE